MSEAVEIPDSETSVEEFRLASLMIYLVSAVIGSLVVYLGYNAGNGPLAASAIIGLSIIGYAIALSIAPEYRRIFLATALGAHVTAILLYYSNPVPLPFFILERAPEGTTLNVDVVQLVLLYEYFFTRELGKKKRTPQTDGNH